MTEDGCIDIAFPESKLGIRLTNRVVVWVSDESAKLGAKVGMTLIKVGGIKVSNMKQKDAIKIIKAHPERPLCVTFSSPKTTTESTTSSTTMSTEEDDIIPDDLKVDDDETSFDEEMNRVDDGVEPQDMIFIMTSMRKLHAQLESGDLTQSDYEQTISSFGFPEKALKQAENALRHERECAQAEEAEKAKVEDEKRVQVLSDVQKSLVFMSKGKPTPEVKLLEGESKRSLILQGEMQRVRSKHSVFVSSTREMYLFLLTDMLIVSDRKKSLFKKGTARKEKGQVFSVRYEVEEVVRLDVVGVVTLTDLRFMKDSPEHSFKITSPSRDHIFVAPDRETKMRWLNTVRTQILKNTPSDVRDSMIGYEHIVLGGTFFSACMIGRQDILKRLLESDVKADEINALDSHGYTALHYAAKTGNASCMKLLCSSPLVIKDIASSRSEHEMPLHMTVSKEHAQCSQMLLEAGAKSSSRDATGRTALHRIVPKAALQANGDHASHQCVRLLLKYRCKDEQLLKNRQSSFDTTKDRVAPSKDPLDMFRDLNTGDSILMSAVASHAHNPGIHHVVFSLLEAGALVNQRRRGDRRSALHIACSSRRRIPTTALLDTLLRVGAEPNLVDHGLNTALHLLLMPRVNMWIQAKSDGSSFNAAQTAKATSMGEEQGEAEQARRAAMMLLVSYGARVDVENKEGCMVKYVLTSEETSQLEAIYGKWQTRKISPQTSKVVCLLDIGATVVSEDAQVEDSHSDRCQLCGLQFSTFTRRHHCKSSGLLVCWYCTTKSFPLLLDFTTKEQQEGRVSDGQWNKLNWLASNWTEKKKSAAEEDEESSKQRADSWVDAADEMRKLGATSNSVNQSKKSDDKVADEKKKNLGGTNSTAMKALSKVNERTEKLNDAVLQAEQLADSADEFEKMARMLAEKEEKKFFGLGKFF